MTPDAAKTIAEAVFAAKEGPAQGSMPLQDQVRRRVQMPLDVELDDDDIVEIAQQFAELHQTLAKHHVEASKVKKDLQKEEESLEAKITDAAKKIRTRQELRIIDCEHVVDYASNSYFEVRLDTNEELPGTRRALSPMEMQRELGLTPEQRRQNDFAEAVKDAQESELEGAPRYAEPDEQEDEE